MVIWIKWVAVVAAVLLAVFAFLSAFGAWRWNAGNTSMCGKYATRCPSEIALTSPTSRPSTRAVASACESRSARIR